MIGWLWRMIVGRLSACEHKWATFSEMTCHPRGRPEMLAGTIYGQRCDKCGDITQRYVGLR